MGDEAAQPASTGRLSQTEIGLSFSTQAARPGIGACDVPSKGREVTCGHPALIQIRIGDLSVHLCGLHARVLHGLLGTGLGLAVGDPVAK